MKNQSPNSAPGNLRVFVACLLSFLLIMMPFVQLAAAARRESGVRSRRPESGRQTADGTRQDGASNMASAAENIFLSAPVPKPAPEPPALAAAPFWVASTLSAGGIAIIGVNTEDVIPGGASANDTITFILLKPIGSGTVIFFSDRNWNGTTFPAAGGGDST